MDFSNQHLYLGHGGCIKFEITTFPQHCSLFEMLRDHSVRSNQLQPLVPMQNLKLFHFFVIFSKKAINALKPVYK